MATKLALIGSGHMGSAVACGVAASGLVDEIVVTAASEASQQALAAKVGCKGTCDNAAAVDGADVVVLAVKPQVLAQVVADFATKLTAGAIVVSLAAGITLETLESLFPIGTKIVRAMPNLPAQVGAGMTSLSPNEQVSKEELAFVQRLFNSFGKSELVPESQIDAVVAVSGSSPAYVCLFIEALADGAEKEGMPREAAYAFAEQAVLGTAKYLQETGVNPAKLADMVCSPGGTTIEAVKVLNASDFNASVVKAMQACAARNRALG